MENEVKEKLEGICTGCNGSDDKSMLPVCIKYPDNADFFVQNGRYQMRFGKGTHCYKTIQERNNNQNKGEQ